MYYVTRAYELGGSNMADSHTSNGEVARSDQRSSVSLELTIGKGVILYRGP
jgi:hypothetical protein